MLRVEVPVRSRHLEILPLLVVALALVAIGVDRVARADRSEAPSLEEPMPSPRLSASGHDITPLPQAAVRKLAAGLDAETYRVTQRAGTEPPFCGELLHQHEEGTYTCAVCGLPLFSSDDKFDSGTGWPSFTGPVDPEHVTQRRDSSHGMVRTEIACARCDAHLGHVFPDGPRPAGQRYCLNSAAMGFVPAE
jgi:methionine-R-sulfoxide reductase